MGWILGEKFNTVYPHKGSIKVLWETRWKLACEKSIYPFHDGCIEDFEHIFQYLIAVCLVQPVIHIYTSMLIK